MEITGILNRIACRLVPNGDCWEWVGSRASNGYGQVWADGSMVLIHRYVYALLRGPIPQGLEIDHLCRNRACARIDHLEAVTPWENTLRSDNLIARQARQTHCKRGHEFTPENTRVEGGSHRRCRACAKARPRRDYTRSR